MASSSTIILSIVACTLIQTALAYPLEDIEPNFAPSYVYVYDDEPQEIHHQRQVRSLQPGAPNFPIPGQQKQDGWKFDPSLSRGEDGNTRGSINVQHTGPNHEVNANWGKVVRGPGKAKPTYSIHGSWRW